MRTTTVIREGNILKLIEPVDIPEGKTIKIIVPDRSLTENLCWLKLSEKSFEFWNNEEDKIWNRV